MDMRIVNDEGQELPWDGKAAGELQVRGPHVLKAYFRVCFKVTLQRYTAEYAPYNAASKI